MSHFSHLITSRYNTAYFTNQPLSPDHVELILKAGLLTHTSTGVKSCHFLVVEDKQTLQELSQCTSSETDALVSSALAVVVLADPLITDSWIEEAAVASAMIQLQAIDLGLGSYWIQIREHQTLADTPSDEFVKNLLEIPLQLQVVCIIALGHKDKAVIESSVESEDLHWENVHIGKYI